MQGCARTARPASAFAGHQQLPLAAAPLLPPLPAGPVAAPLQQLLGPSRWAAPLQPQPQPLSKRPVRARQPMRVAAAAAPAAASAAAKLPLFTATGVPLVETLAALTLQQATARALFLIAATAAGVALGNKLLEIGGQKMEEVAGRTQSSGGLQLLAGSALASAYGPAKMLLPLYGLFYSLLVMSAYAKVAAMRMAENGTDLPGFLHLGCHQLLEGLMNLSQLMQDTSELVIIVFFAWFAIAWKDQLMGALLERMEPGEGGGDAELQRVLVPLSAMATGGILVAAVLSTLVCFGINIQPLLAFGSISTVAVGFAAQSTMQNVVSALQIYSTRPFIIGDRIQLKTLSGSVVVAGVVEVIMPMRTVLRGDNRLPIYIQNKDVMNLIVVNESKLRRVPVASKQPLIESGLVLRYQDVDKAAAIARDIEEPIKAHELTDDTVSPRCVLAEFTEAGPRLAFRMLLHRQFAGRSAYVQGELLAEAERIVRSHGAYLAISEDYGAVLPPSPPPPQAAT